MTSGARAGSPPRPGGSATAVRRSTARSSDRRGGPRIGKATARVSTRARHRPAARRSGSGSAPARPLAAARRRRSARQRPRRSDPAPARAEPGSGAPEAAPAGRTGPERPRYGRPHAAARGVRNGSASRACTIAPALGSMNRSTVGTTWRPTGLRNATSRRIHRRSPAALRYGLALGSTVAPNSLAAPDSTQRMASRPSGVIGASIPCTAPNDSHERVRRRRPRAADRAT